MARELKDPLYEQFARVGKAVASPRRIELLDLLAQSERSVEALASLTGMGVANTSQHLQQLRQARLVATRRQGTQVLYRLAGAEVLSFVEALQGLAQARLAEVGEVVSRFLDEPDGLEPLRREDLLARVTQGDVVVLDVRPREEYDAGHIPGAVSIPVDELAERLDELPAGVEVVAYCRGPYCLFAHDAVRLLRERGVSARRVVDGLPQWHLAGLPVAVGVAPGEWAVAAP